jgi:hypothetical protein
MTPPFERNDNAERARARGDALAAALTNAARGADLEPALARADDILADGFYTGTRGELLASMLVRLELIDYDTGTHTAPYFGLSTRLVELGACTPADMKAAVCGGILMLGQERGWLEPYLYDALAHAARDRPDWQLAMSVITRRVPDPPPTSRHTTQ